jgi:DNA topoisomerase IB
MVISPEFFDLPVEKRVKITQELVKSLGFQPAVAESDPDHDLWRRHPDENMAQLEDYYKQNLSVGAWGALQELLDLLDLSDIDVDKSFDGGLSRAFEDLLEKSLWNEADHPRDEDGRFTTKWGRAMHIGHNIDGIRKKWRKDLKLKGMPRDKVTALMIGLIDKGCFRIGNEESDDEGVFGLTTIRREHIKVQGDTIHFDFIGKKKVHQQHSVTDKDLARVMKEVLKIEGGKRSGGKEDASDAVFKYQNTQGEIRTPSQYVVNSYLKDWGVTAKDFRTYHASRIVYELLKEKNTNVPAEKEKNVRVSIEEAAKRLGHTPDTTKRSYLDPKIIELYMADMLKAMDFDLYYNEPGDGDTLEKAQDDGTDLHDKLMSGVRRRYKARLHYSPDGKPYTLKQLAEINGVIQKYMPNAEKFGESLAVRAVLLGKLMSELEVQNLQLAKLAIETIPSDIQAVRENFTVRPIEGDPLPVLPLQTEEINTIKWASLHAGEHLQGATDDLIQGVRQLVIQARQDRLTPQELAQRLYDKFGEYNRDWRRIAIMETSSAMNNGYLMTLQDGDTLTIEEAADCCKKCREINVGRTFTYRVKPGDPETEIWVGKNNVGKKQADWKPCVPLHPHCRAKYLRLNSTFYKMVDGKIVLKNAQEILAEKEAKTE